MDNINNKKVSTSISLDYKSYEYIKENKINFSEWVNDKILQEFEDKEKIIKRLEREIEEKQKNIKNLKSELTEEKQKDKTKLNRLSPEQIEEIKESVKIIKERGYNFFGGRYNKYKNLYDPKISKEQFEELLKICNI